MTGSRSHLPQFCSFLWVGYECTYALAEEGRRFDLLRASQHDTRCREDYKLAKERGICTVREGFAWHEVDRGGSEYDFSRFEPMVRAASELNIQQIWDLCHFDFPEDIDPFSEHLALRYAEYAKRCVSLIRHYYSNTLYICPMNEASFFAWMCDQGLWAPYQKGKGTAFKKQLVKAAIAAMDAIWSVDSDVQFIHVDPYMYRRPLHKKSQLEREFCDNFNEHVRFHSWDMIVGKANPELGGDPKYLNLIGINYYFYNQQEVGIDPQDPSKYSFKSISLTNKHRLSLQEVIRQVHDRYHVPVVISETGSYRDRRPSWWQYILSEVDQSLATHLPLYGVCAYPTLDIKKGAGFIIPQSGLWDFNQRDKSFQRLPHEPTWQVIEPYLRHWQRSESS